MASALRANKTTTATLEMDRSLFIVSSLAELNLRLQRKKRCPMPPVGRPYNDPHDTILAGRVRGQINMKIYVVLAWLCTGVAFTAKAEPLVTISCEKPEGSSTTYGVPLKERLDALAQEQPEPVNPTLRGPTKNEYQGKPTFVIDANRKKITIVWSEMLPSLPASDGVIVQFLPEQISAIQVEPWSITTFSFFPKMGTVFIGQQSMALDFHNAMQLSTFARCEFSWSKPQ